MIGYPSQRLREEVAYLAWHLHWSFDEIMGMEHLERSRWVAEVVRIQESIRNQQTLSESR
jgi:hypothetical protein